MAIAPTALPAADTHRSVTTVVSPQRVLYVIWALFWLIMILVSVQEELHNPYIRWWEPLVWEGSSCIVATAWMLFQRHGKQRYARYLDQPLRWFGLHLLWLPLLVVTFISSAYAIRHGVYAWVGETYEHRPWSFVFVYESLKLALFTGLWLGIIFGFDSFEQWQAQRRRLLEMQKTLAEAQLSQLKAQLRPHFFFNALNTISSLMQVDVERADRLLARLGDLLRASLQSSGQELTSLRDELRTLELFAQIMQERFADRVSLAWQVDPEVLDMKIPGMNAQAVVPGSSQPGQRLVYLQSLPAAHDVWLRAGVDAERLAVDCVPATSPGGGRHRDLCHRDVVVQPRRYPPRHDDRCLHSKRVHLDLRARVHRLWLSPSVVLQSAAALGAGRELSDLYPAPDRDRGHWVLRHPGLLESRGEVLGRARCDPGELLPAV